MEKELRTVATMTTLLAFLLCPAFSQGPAVDAKVRDEQDIYAAVIRHQMEEWVGGGDKSEAEAKNDNERSVAKILNFKVFFVSLNGKDPSDEFINRFRDVPRSIRKVSSAERSKSGRRPLDKTTHLTGIVFDAEDLRWLDKDSAEVKGGYYCGGLCASGITFTVRRENGEWVVKTSHMNWIS